MNTEAVKDRYGSGLLSGCLGAMFLVTAAAVTLLNWVYLEQAKKAHQRIEIQVRENAIVIRVLAIKAGITRAEIRNAIRPPADD